MMRKIEPILLDAIRFILGVLFIFSGMVKLVDPIGFGYKLEEYFEVFNERYGFPLFFVRFSLFLSIFFSTLEVALGVALLVGYRLRQVVTFMLGLILFFTFLTGYSAITDAVRDCGCFGDFIKLTPWQSFIKDVILTVLVLYLFVRRKQLERQVPKAGLITALGTLLALAFGLWNYLTLPVVDFRPYKKGNNLWALMQIPEGAPRDEYITILIYRNRQTGEEVQISSEEFMQRYQEFQDTTVWEFVTSESRLVRKGYTPPIHDFVLLDSTGQDRTEAILNQPGPYFFLIVYPDYFRADALGKVVQELRQVQQHTPVPVYVLNAFPAEEWQQLAQQYQVPDDWQVLNVDATALKTFIRSSPGIVLMNGPIVQDKWHWRTFDAAEAARKAEEILPVADQSISDRHA